jgi:hypothetical protein
MEYEFRQEIMNRLYDYAYKRRVQYDKDLMVVDIPEFSKLPEDTIEAQVDVWITKLVIEGRLYKAYNDFILNTI